MSASYLEASPSRCLLEPFKEAYRALYDKWMTTGEKSYTAAGNICAPSKLQAVQWVKKAWSVVHEDMVRKSFRVCGILVNHRVATGNSSACS